MLTTWTIGYAAGMAPATILLGALTLPAGAAEAPDERARAVRAPDERAAARVFADAGLRYAEAIDPLAARLTAQPEREEERRCANRTRRRTSEHRWDVVDGLTQVQDDLRPLARLLEPLFTRFSLDLHSVDTADRRCAAAGPRCGACGGSRRDRDAPRMGICTRLQRWERAGFEPTRRCGGGWGCSPPPTGSPRAATSSAGCAARRSG